MRLLVLVLVLFLSSCTTSGQKKLPKDFGYQHLQTVYNGDTVDILIKSKTNDSLRPKPLLLFCQGSLPQPLIKYDEKGPYGVFGFNPDSLSSQFHLAIISKPYVPVVAYVKSLGGDYAYRDKTGKFPKGYVQRNYLDYYVNRNIAVLQFLQKKAWVSKEMLVVAGHSEGSTIAAKMASIFPGITHLIYSGGNPMGRMSTLIQRARSKETPYAKEADYEFLRWEQIVADPTNMKDTGDTYKVTFDFSIPPIDYLLKLKIPVLVSYGTADSGSPFNDYLHIETIRQRKKNFTFNAYIKTEHNYFPVRQNGSVDYNTFNWDKVAGDWRKWLIQKGPQRPK